MPSGIVRQMVADLTRNSTSKGKKFVNALNAKLTQEKIARELPKTQECKKY